MSFATASGVPNLSGNYLPTVYASMLLVEFYAATVFGAIASTEFENQIEKFGDKLRIRMLPEIVSNEYVKGQNLVYQDGDPSFVDLDIDKGRYWGMRINALDKKQSDLNYITNWAKHAAEKQKIAIDADVLANVYGDVDAHNKGTTAGKKSGDINLGASGGSAFQMTSSTVVQKIVDCGTVLDEQDVPDEGRWIVLPAWACGLIKKSDLADAAKTGDEITPLRNGKLGMIDRFTVYMSNNVEKVTDTVSCWNAMFGWKGSLAFASQMLLTETLKNPNDFGDLMRSLQAYGYKVVKPEGIGHLYIKK